jgi:hypothetical protein
VMERRSRRERKGGVGKRIKLGRKEAKTMN